MLLFWQETGAIEEDISNHAPTYRLVLKRITQMADLVIFHT